MGGGGVWKERERERDRFYCKTSFLLYFNNKCLIAITIGTNVTFILNIIIRKKGKKLNVGYEEELV